MKVFHISPENFLADGGVRVEGDTGKICEIFSSEFGISSHICRSKGKGGIKKIILKISRQNGCLISIGKRRDVYGHLFGEILLYLM